MSDYFASSLWGIPVLSLITAGAGAYIGSYLKKRAENLATKDDFNDLKAQTAALTQTAKQIEAKISDEVWASQRQFEMKQDGAFKALKAYHRFRDACGAFVSAEEKYRKADSESAAEKLGDERVNAAVEWRQALGKLVDVLNILRFVGGPVTRMKVGSLCELLLRLNEAPPLELWQELSLTSKGVSDAFESIRITLRAELGLVDALDVQELLDQKMNEAMRLTKRSWEVQDPGPSNPAAK
jgi:hypothetical protein